MCSLRLYQAYDRDAGVRDIKDTLDAVAKLPDCTGKIAVQGYCLGALMTFMTVVRCHVDAAVATRKAWARSDRAKTVVGAESIRSSKAISLLGPKQLGTERRKHEKSLVRQA